MQVTARRLFRGVTLDLVRKEDMANSSPNPQLMQLTVPATPNQVDAFLSHSWHDDGDAKWVQLERWARDFRASEKREPITWLDKAWCVPLPPLRVLLSSSPL